MKTLLKYPSIKQVVMNDDQSMEIILENGRTVLIPLDEFPEIKNLSKSEKEDFEVIDGEYLSFLSLDRLFGIKELIGVF